MSNISKFNHDKANVKAYEFSFDFARPKPPPEPEVEGEAPKEENVATKSVLAPKPKTPAEKALEQAKEKAKEIIEQAQNDARKIRDKAFQEGESGGFDIGYSTGYKQGYDENKKKLDYECNAFLTQLDQCISDVEEKKQQLLHSYLGELKDLSISIAEKVIHVSLKSSGQVIEKMILSATEKLKTKEWAKIYIAKCDAQRMVHGDSEFMRSIAHLSEHVKIIAMENEMPGTCIIELPDQIIDAGVTAQLENIKEILNNAGV